MNLLLIRVSTTFDSSKPDLGCSCHSRTDSAFADAHPSDLLLQCMGSCMDRSCQNPLSSYPNGSRHGGAKTQTVKCHSVFRNNLNSLDNRFEVAIERYDHLFHKDLCFHS